MVKEAANPQSKHADPLIPSSSLQKYLRMSLSLWVCGSWDKDSQKVGFHCLPSSFSHKTTD